MRYIVILLSLMTVASAQEAEQVLFCTDNETGGFDAEEGVFNLSNFTPSRFTAKFSEDFSTLVSSNEKGLTLNYNCTMFYIGSESELVLVNCQSFSSNIIYNLQTKKYARSMLDGWVVNNDVDIVAAFGTCTKF